MIYTDEFITQFASIPIPHRPANYVDEDFNAFEDNENLYEGDMLHSENEDCAEPIDGENLEEKSDDCNDHEQQQNGTEQQHEGESNIQRNSTMPPAVHCVVPVGIITHIRGLVLPPTPMPPDTERIDSAESSTHIGTQSLPYTTTEQLLTSGIANTGVKCFGISVTQAIASVPRLCSYLTTSSTDNGHQCALTNNCIAHAIGQVITMTTDNTHGSVCFEAVESLLINYAMETGHQDAADFLDRVIRSTINCELMYNNEQIDQPTRRLYDTSGCHRSELSKEHATRLSKLTGVYIRTIHTHPAPNPHTTSTLTPMHYLPLEIQWTAGQANSINEALQRFVDPELIPTAYCYICDPPAIRNTMASCIIFQLPLPQVLCIQLKRFTSAVQKIDHAVSIKPMLYLPGHDNYPFKLCSVVCHEGSAYEGHYYTYALKYIELTHERWFRISDSQVTALENSAPVLNTQFAYLLFYQQIQPSELEEQNITHAVGNGSTQKECNSTVDQPKAIPCDNECSASFGTKTSSNSTTAPLEKLHEHLISQSTGNNDSASEDLTEGDDEGDSAKETENSDDREFIDNEIYNDQSTDIQNDSIEPTPINLTHEHLNLPFKKQPFRRLF